MSNPDIYKAQVPRRTSRHRFRGVNYAVSEWGDPEKPMFIWLHGWGDCAATFQFVVDELEKDWYVVAPDFRGFGESKTDAAAFWFPDYLADLDCLLDAYSPDEPVRLVGHSMGANVGGLYAGVLPERVCAFINVEGFGLADSDPSDAPDRYRKWLEMSRSGSKFSTYPDFASLAGRVKKRSPHIGDARAEFVARCWAHADNGHVELHASPRHRLPNAVLYRRAESEACWRNVSAPVLLVAGGNSDFARAVHDWLDIGSLALPFPGATTTVIDGAGHMMHFEAPAELASVIEAFLAKTL